MTESEFLANLQTKVLYMGSPSMLDNASPTIGANGNTLTLSAFDIRTADAVSA